MELESIFKNFGSLFEVFNWWSLALIVGVVLVMIPINMLYKKIMKKDGLSRLRKTTSFISVYLISLAAIAGFTGIASTGFVLTFEYLSGTTLALGFCSQFLWEIIKLVRDYGFSKVIKSISEKVDWKKALKEFGKKYNIDTKITDVIATAIENKYLDQINADSVKAFAENEFAMINEIQSKLTGFVETNNIKEVAAGIYTMLKESWE